MTRDSRFYTFYGNDGSSIIEEIEGSRYKHGLYPHIAIYQVYKDIANGCVIISLSDEIDEIVSRHGAIENHADLIRHRLKEASETFPLIYGDRDVVEFLKYLIPQSPSTIDLHGTKKETYTFQAFNIGDNIRENAAGIYVFTTTQKDNTANFGRYSHILHQFVSVAHDNKEAIRRAKERGAEHVLYLFSPSETERKEIIEDIKSSEAYRNQLILFPGLGWP